MYKDYYNISDGQKKSEFAINLKEEIKNHFYTLTVNRKNDDTIK